MNPWIAILIVAGTTGVVAFLATLSRAPRVTQITRTTTDDPET